ncbi:hypothetical protein [Pantoea sp.]|nr:hypothetical protein [Pantoea sp.]
MSKSPEKNASLTQPEVYADAAPSDSASLKTQIDLLLEELEATSSLAEY